MEYWTYINYPKLMEIFNTCETREERLEAIKNEAKELVTTHLTIDDIMETGDEYCKKWVRYLDKYGLPFKNAMVFQEEHNVWRPMTHEDILSYEEFFSYFIGKKVIVCNEYSTRIFNT